MSNAGCIKAAAIAPHALQIVVREGQGWQACIPRPHAMWATGNDGVHGPASLGRLRRSARQVLRIGRSSLAWGGWFTWFSRG